MQAIAASLGRFGQLRPILVQESTGRIVAGNHTYQAAQLLGADDIAAVFVNLDDDDARDYLAADNRTSDLASYDDAALAQLLMDTADAGRLEGTGYDAAYVDSLVARLDASHPYQAPPEPPPTVDVPGPPPAPRQAPAGPQTPEPVVAIRFDTYSQAQEFESALGDYQERFGIRSRGEALVEALERALAP